MNTTSFVSPWTRFFARAFDLFISTIVIFFSLSVLFVLGISDEFSAWLNQSALSLLFFIYLCFHLSLLLDAIVYHGFGNTIGKALLGIKVTNHKGFNLDFNEYLQRNLILWAKGLGFGLPIVNIITMLFQYSRLNQGLDTTYDAQLGFCIYDQRKIPYASYTFQFCILSVCLIIFTASIFPLNYAHYIKDTFNRTTLNQIVSNKAEEAVWLPTGYDPDAMGIDKQFIHAFLVSHPVLIAGYFLLFLFCMLIFITSYRILRYFSRMIQESAYFKRIEITQKRLQAQHLKHLSMSRVMMANAKKKNDERVLAIFSNTNEALFRLDQSYIVYLDRLKQIGIDDNELLELRKNTISQLYRETIEVIRSNQEDLSELDVIGEFAENKIAQMTNTFEKMQKGVTYQ